MSYAVEKMFMKMNVVYFIRKGYSPVFFSARQVPQFRYNEIIRGRLHKEIQLEPTCNNLRQLGKVASS